MEKYDVLVIGSGGGTKIAIPAAKKGLKTALVERDAFGGTCLNRGCIPSKMFVYPADLLYAIRHAHRVNLEVNLDIELDFQGLVDRINSTVNTISRNGAANVTKIPSLDLIEGNARFIDSKIVEVNGRQLTADKIVIATGAKPSVPEIPGLAGTPFMTSTEALRCRELPQRMIILGASYIACEIGHVYDAFGVETHFIVRSELLRLEDKDVRAAFLQDFQKRHTIHQDSVAVAVEYQDGVFCMRVCNTRTGEESEIFAEALLVASGATPSTAGLGLEKTGVQLTEKGFIQVDNYMQTTADGIYALGDCVGRYMFRHSVNFEGEYLMEHLFSSKKKKLIQYPPMPRAVFSVPEVAAVGKTEDELMTAGIDYVAGSSEYTDSNIGLARQLNHGFAKILVDKKDGKILGAHILGEEAATLIHMLIALMTQHATLDDLLAMIYIHPALAEVVRDAGRDARRKMG